LAFQGGVLKGKRKKSMIVSTTGVVTKGSVRKSRIPIEKNSGKKIKRVFGKGAGGKVENWGEADPVHGTSHGDGDVSKAKKVRHKKVSRGTLLSCARLRVRGTGSKRKSDQTEEQYTIPTLLNYKIPGGNRVVGPSNGGADERKEEISKKQRGG